MKHFLKIKRKKSPEPPHQPTFPGDPFSLDPGPPEDGRGGTDPFRNGMDVGQEPTASGPPMSGLLIGGSGHRNGEFVDASDTGWRGIDAAEASRAAKRARKGASLGDVNEATEKFGPLKVVLGAIPPLFANREGSVAAGNKIKMSSSGNSRGIEGQLCSLCKKPEWQQLTDHAQDEEEAFRLLEDLQVAVVDYQMARQTMIYNQELKSIARPRLDYILYFYDHSLIRSIPSSAEAAVLNHFRSARQAEYRHGDRNGCLRGTRGAILDEIELWSYDFYKPSVYWLNGLAGTGKSTIAQTISERTFADGRLGASFFCSRDFEDRSNLKSIFPTLAVQLARNYPKFRSIFVPLIQADPEIVHESLYGQMNKLVVQPLVESSVSTVIVIDALDECKDEEPASAILSVLGQFVAQIPKVKFFVTGRPEPRIREGFRLPLLAEATDVFVLHEVESSRVNSDIRLFFGHKFSEIRSRRRGMDGWPTAEQQGLLCERTGGLFVHAIATVRFIDQKNVNPKEQLVRLLRSPDSRFEGKIKFKVNTTLDSLYITILQEAFGDDDPEGDPRVRSVLAAVILAMNPLSPATIATLLSIDTEDVFPLLSSLHSLLVLREDVDHPVRPFHKSFPDFIVDPTRCINQRFHISPPAHHAEFLLGCLETMNRRLEKNMCKLPDGVTNSEVADLRERTEQYIDEGLQYACQSWHKHLIHTTPVHSPEIVPVLRRFLEEKFPFWLEVLSVLGTAREAVDALTAAEQWLDTSPTPTPGLVKDYFRFVITFFEVISTSAPHIYHTAIPLSPRGTTVRELYERYASPLARVVHGLPSSWEQIVATFNTYNGDTLAAWSPCNRFIAISGHSEIGIVDAVTLKKLNTLECGESETWRLSFSPDSRFLTQFSDCALTSWDLQTGGLVGTTLLVDQFSPRSSSSTYSVDGKIIAVASKSHDDTTFTIATYDLLPKARLYSYTPPKGHLIPPIWTDGERIRFVTMVPGSISVYEVGFISINTLAEVETLPLPDRIPPSKNLLFLPTLSRLAFTLKGNALIWDARNSKPLLDFVGRDSFREMSFSPDGRFFACTTDRELHLWKESPVGYTPHQNVVLTGLGESARPLFSPNGEYIIMLNGFSVNLWPTSDPFTPPSSIPDGHGDRDDFLLEFSADETLAAVVPPEGGRIEIIDLETGDPRLVIEVDISIYCMGLTGSMVVVADYDGVAAWDIPARDSAPNARAIKRDLFHQMTFDHWPWTPSLVKSTRSISPDLNYVAITLEDRGSPGQMNIYNTWTGECLASVPTEPESKPHFTPEGCEVWSVPLSGPVARWTIPVARGSCLLKLERLPPIACPLGVTRPSESSHGYKVQLDGWVLSSTQKRLLWLPHHWRSLQWSECWQGRFFGYLHGEPPEVVILEFFE
ncbi:hypothetical protein BJ322DRAFT_1104775 [Thelephora terrestris]|uniref:Nephrocystin 3-like N-terminal domain-containing protein n=1 Tax=Thelephora terrestris TaxID=56493 RepID=A0A9P6LBV2_9AGAM|nr:hypothetical protein BJ322DRAFT_1104775 [Thelephora terrestris]